MEKIKTKKKKMQEWAEYLLLGRSFSFSLH
jgi:hypothetical protein